MGCFRSVDGAPGWWDVALLAVAEVSLLAFAVSQFLGRYSKKNNLQACVCVDVSWDCCQPGNERYVRVSLKYLNPLSSKIQRGD